MLVLSVGDLERAHAAIGVSAPVRFDEVTGSTNATALDLAEEGTAEWTLVAAGHQTEGPGPPRPRLGGRPRSRPAVLHRPATQVGAGDREPAPPARRRVDGGGRHPGRRRAGPVRVAERPPVERREGRRDPHGLLGRGRRDPPHGGRGWCEPRRAARTAGRPRAGVGGSGCAPDGVPRAVRHHVPAARRAGRSTRRAAPGARCPRRSAARSRSRGWTGAASAGWLSTSITVARSWSGPSTAR